jgi:hypothetical protein
VSVGFAIVLSASCSSSAPPTVAEVDNACRNGFSGFDEIFSPYVYSADLILVEQGFDQNTIDKNREMAYKQIRISWETLQRYDRASDYLSLMRKKLESDIPENLQQFDDGLSGGNDLFNFMSKVSTACLAISVLRSDGLLPADE